MKTKRGSTKQSPNTLASPIITWEPTPTPGLRLTQKKGDRKKTHGPPPNSQVHHSPARASAPSLMQSLDVSETHSSNVKGLVSRVNENTTKDPVQTGSISNSSFSPKDTQDPEELGKELAGRCYREDDGFLAKHKIAEWLGGPGPVNKIALRYYMNHFDFAKLRLDEACRRLCFKLYLQADTQQINRILEEFSKRFWQCNPIRLYGSASVVYAITNSLMFNTGVHVAGLSKPMSQSEFVRNTMAAIREKVDPTQFASKTSQDQDRTGSDTWTNAKGTKAPTTGAKLLDANVTSFKGSHDRGPPSGIGSVTGPNDEKWELEMRELLKGFHTAVQQTPLPKPFNLQTMTEQVSDVDQSPIFRSIPKQKFGTTASRRRPGAQTPVSPSSDPQANLDSSIKPYACGHESCWPSNAKSSRSSYRTSRELLNHNEVAHPKAAGERIYRCGLEGCGISYRGIDVLQQHIQNPKSHPQHPHTSATSTTARGHIFTSDEEEAETTRRCVCPHEDCLKEFVSLSVLRSHLAYAHPNPPNYVPLDPSSKVVEKREYQGSAPPSTKNQTSKASNNPTRDSFGP